MDLPSDAPGGMPENCLNDTSYCSWTPGDNITLSGCDIIENLNRNIQEIQGNNLKKYKLVQIKNELLESIDDSFKAEIEADDSIVTERDIISKNTSMIEEMLEKIRKQNNKVLEMENVYKNQIKGTKEDVEKITTFSDFLKNIVNQFPEENDEEINAITDDLVSLSEKIKNNNNCMKIRKEYQRELYLLNEYRGFLKKINNGNIGNTCSLCLQNPVNTYFNPCGHTGCSECIKALYASNEHEYNVNCFICRKRISSNHPIYFI
jgi:hypothetical protein